jgi:hypothetical protein
MPEKNPNTNCFFTKNSCGCPTVFSRAIQSPADSKLHCANWRHNAVRRVEPTGIVIKELIIPSKGLVWLW